MLNRIAAIAGLGVNRVRVATRGFADPQILLACMPKSGSTFCSDVLAELHGMEKRFLVPSWGGREQELDRLLALASAHVPYVAQHHVRGHAWTRQVIRDFELTPIVLVRNIFDAAISLRDHVRTEGPDMPLLPPLSAIRSMSDADLDTIIAHFAIPWYLNFWTSWTEVGASTPVFHYEHMVENPTQFFADVSGKVEIQKDPGEINRAISAVAARGGHRLNVGVIGRGEQLSEQARDIIKSCAAAMVGRDLSPIGL